MILFITGSPGTGKSTVSRILSERTGYQLLEVSRIIDRDMVIEEDRIRKTEVVDIDKLKEKIRSLCKNGKDYIIEGHLSHLLDMGDMVVVLRTSPKDLKKRLEGRGYSEDKILENQEAEALDVCLIESLENYKEVYEVETTGRTPEDTVEEIFKILKGKGAEFRPGKIDYSEEFFTC